MVPANLYTTLLTIVVPLTILEKEDSMWTLVAHCLTWSQRALSLEKKLAERLLRFLGTFVVPAQTSPLGPVKFALQCAQ